MADNKKLIQAKAIYNIYWGAAQTAHKNTLSAQKKLDRARVDCASGNFGEMESEIWKLESELQGYQDVEQVIVARAKVQEQMYKMRKEMVK